MVSGSVVGLNCLNLIIISKFELLLFFFRQNKTIDDIAVGIFHCFMLTDKKVNQSINRWIIYQENLTFLKPEDIQKTEKKCIWLTDDWNNKAVIKILHYFFLLINWLIVSVLVCFLASSTFVRTGVRFFKTVYLMLGINAINLKTATTKRGIRAQRCRPPICHLCTDSNILLYSIAPLAVMW